MITHKTNPARWAHLLVELDDAREHLESLIEEMNDRGAVEEPQFASDLGHIYAHLNRVWHTRNEENEAEEERWTELSNFPKDLQPVD